MNELKFWKSSLFSEDFLIHTYSFDANYDDLYKKFKEIWIKEKNNVSFYNKAQLEDHFIKPILKILDHDFEFQEYPTEEKSPEYILFSSNNDRNLVNSKKSQSLEEFYKLAIGVGTTTSWAMDLDKKTQNGSSFDLKIPSFQIYAYLQQTGLKWGFLTNGKVWRIYYKDTAIKMDSFIEFNLINILTHYEDRIDLGAKKSFSLFVHLFLKASFIPDTRNNCILDYILKQSKLFSVELGEAFQNNLFEALRMLAIGFFDWKENNLEKNEKNLYLVYKACIKLLYRILFILFAENRFLLPLENKLYKNQFSLESLITIINSNQRTIKSLSKCTLYNHLILLFKLFNKGGYTLFIPHEDFYLQTYEGELFNPSSDDLMNKLQISDFYFLNTLKLITFREEGGKSKRIDLNKLEILQLVSIYEKILEYSLYEIKEEYVCYKKDQNVIYKPRKKFNPKLITDFEILKKGEIILVRDPIERSVTGSYYTPKSIVNFIVKKTLDPIIEEKISIATKNNLKIIDQILKIKVLDPAMGSGYFLVGVMDYLACKIIEFSDLGNNPCYESDVISARRDVLRNCIYGVDSNPLATELAKLTLWLSTISKEKPFSFLDHHLKTGDSLIGGDISEFINILIKDLKLEDSKKSLLDPNNLTISYLYDFLDIPEAMGFENIFNEYLKAVSLTDESIDNNFLKKEALTKLNSNEIMVFLKRISELMVLYHINGKKFPELFSNELKKIDEFSFDTINNIMKSNDVISILKILDDKSLFNWQLEFLDIFNRDQGGFDVIVMNPPYIFSRDKKVSENWKKYYFSYYSTLKDKPNTYSMFLELSFKLLKKNGITGLIIPNSLITIPAGEKSRKFLLENTTIKEIVGFFGSPFNNATVEPVILTFRKQKPENNSVRIYFSYIDDKNFLIHEKENHTIEQIDWLKNNQYIFSIYTRKKEQEILDKIFLNSEKLDDITELRSGLQAYEAGKGNPKQTKDDVKQHIFDYDHKFDESTYKYLEPGDINRFSYTWGGRWLRWGEWLSSPREFSIFSKNRILIREITGKYPKSILGCFFDETYINNKSILNIVEKEKSSYKLLYILGIINSSVLSFYFKHSAVKAMRQLFPKIILEDLKSFPIAKANNEEQEAVIDLVKKILLKKKELNDFILTFADWAVQQGWWVSKPPIILKQFYNYDVNNVIKRIPKVNISPKDLINFNSYFEKNKKACLKLEHELELEENELNKKIFELYKIDEKEQAIIYNEQILPN